MTNQTIYNFIQDFKKTSYYEYMYNRPGVIMSYVTGSRLVKTESPLSDFDIIIITDTTAKIEDTGVRFKYKDIFTVHFYYHTIDQFLTNTYTMSDNLYGTVQVCDLDRSMLIYENTAYDTIITRFFEKKNTISRISMLKYIKNFDFILKEVSDTNLLDIKYYHKYLYHICRCYYRLARIEQDTQLLLQAKYCASSGLTAESVEKIIEIFKTLLPVANYHTVEDLVAQFEPYRNYVLEGKLDG